MKCSALALLLLSFQQVIEAKNHPLQIIKHPVWTPFKCDEMSTAFQSGLGCLTKACAILESNSQEERTYL